MMEASGGDNDEDRTTSRERAERLLPAANVSRIMKQALPPNTKVSKEAKKMMQECASEFISFVTSEVSHKCKQEDRKTLNGDDVCSVMSMLGFDFYSDAMQRYLRRYRESEVDEARQARSNAEGMDRDHPQAPPSDTDDNRNQAGSSTIATCDHGSDRLL